MDSVFVVCLVLFESGFESSKRPQVPYRCFGNVYGGLMSSVLRRYAIFSLSSWSVLRLGIALTCFALGNVIL